MDPEEGSTKTRPTEGDLDAGIDQAEAFANDPQNASRDFVAEKGSENGSANRQGRLSQGLSALKNAKGSNKVKLAGGGAGIVALLLAATLALLPLKLEAIMKNIFQKRVGAKIEHMEERRADRIVIKYLTKAGSSEAVYADGTLFGSLYKNWARSKFETKFSEKSGIKIEPGEGGKGIKVSYADGKPPIAYANEADFEKYLAKGELKGLDARKFIRDVTRTETHWIQVYKRHNLRKFMRNAYGIHKWSWFTGKEGDPAATEARDGFIDSAAEPVAEDTPHILTCALDGKECPTDDASRDKPHGTRDIEAPHSATGGANGAADDSKSAVKKAFEDAKKISPSKIVEKGLTKVLTGLIGPELAAKFASKALPVIGQILLIDQAARIDHFFTSGKADSALRSAHKLQYAKEFAQFATIADNFKDPGQVFGQKKMSGDEVNAVMTRFNGDEANSAAFQDVFLGKSGGKGLDSNLGVNDTAHPIQDDYNKYSIAGFAVVGPLRAWYAVVDSSVLRHLIDLLNTVINSLIGAIVDQLTSAFPFLKSLLGSIGGFMSSLMLKLITPAVDGTETGAELFNAIDAGGAVTGQDFSKSLGGHALSDAQAYEENNAIAFDQNLSAPSLRDQLFSPEYQYSMINSLAAVAPSSGSAAIGQFSSYSMAVMKNPMSIFDGLFNQITGKAHAAAPTNLYGLQNYGFTEAELDQPLTTLTDRNKDGKIDSDDCRTNEDGTPFSSDQMKAFNDTTHPQLCLLDVAAAESLGAVFTSADDGGIGDNSSPTSAAAPTGTIATGTEQELAKQILANPSITFDYGPTGRIARPLIDLAGGSKASTLDAAPATDVSTTLLGAILLIAQTHKINISSLTTGHSIGDVHSVGRAVDMNIFDGTHTTGRDSNTISIINILTTVLPQGSGFGQEGCPTTPVTLPAGFIQFGDSCDHLHIQVPAGTP